MIDKPKPIIERIQIDKDKLQFLKDLIANPKISPFDKNKIIKKITGLCAICGSYATQIVTYKLDDISLIERYCDTCISKAKL